MLDEFQKESKTQPDRSLLAARITTAGSVTLVQAEISNYIDMTASLELLRGFEEAPRRVVFCDASRLPAGRQLGLEIVERGRAEVLVSCGRTGREVGIGARDAGLDLNRVIVCGNATAGCRALKGLLNEGDTVLMLGIEQSVGEELVRSLRRDSSDTLAMAS